MNSRKAISVIAGMIAIICIISLAGATYVPASSMNVTLILRERAVPASNLNVTLILGAPTGAPPVDSCTYTGGDWNVLCSDNCVITSEVNLNWNRIFMSGTGTFKPNADIRNYAEVFVPGGCSILPGTGRFKE